VRAARFTVAGSLALWRRRLTWRERRLAYWMRRGDHAHAAHWRQRVAEARGKVALRTRQLAARTGGLPVPAQGLDWAWGHPDVAALRRGGYRFACRYLSHDPTKNLTLDQARRLSAAGIACVVVWETTASRALAGHAAGVLDATAALTQARLCGMPAGRPIYFAIDFDEAPGQVDEVADYFRGVHSVLDQAGPADFPRSVPVGAYGGYWAIKRLFDAGLIDYGWQTYAWSGGQWEHRAHIQQFHNGVHVAGVSADLNRSTRRDIGQWKVHA
jgi:hypothetical protein